VPKPTRVLVIEDDPAMNVFYRRLFGLWRAEGFEALFAADAEQALGLLASRAADLAIVDWNLPGLSGQALVAAMRADPRTRGMGILMVTGRGALSDELVALETGCDDHLAKPFDGRRLLARLNSLRRRRDLAFVRQADSRFPGLLFEPHAGKVTVDGRPARLAAKEQELLKVFLQRPNMLHAGAFLWEHAWGYESDTWAHVLATTISSLRRKLGRWGPRLKSVRGSGYLLESA
jgi:DNA-binding response OmpR family regulator